MLPCIIECQSLFFIMFGFQMRGQYKSTIIHIFMWFWMERTLYKAVENILLMTEAIHCLRVLAELTLYSIPDGHV
jgi:hypothetical protein